MHDKLIPFHALRRFAAAHVNAIVPLVAEHLSIAEAVEILKVGVVRYLLSSRGLSVDDAAAKLHLSSRWVYKYKKRSAERSDIPDDLLRPADHELLSYLIERYPSGATVTECLDHFDRIGRPIDANDLVNLLEAYCTLGYITHAAGGYRVRSSALWINESALVGRARRASRLLGTMTALVRDYVETESAVLRHVHVTVTQDAYRELVEEIDTAIQQATRRAVQKSWEASPEGPGEDAVVVDGLWMVGFEAYQPTTRR